MRSLPYISEAHETPLRYLRYLECKLSSVFFASSNGNLVKRLDITPLDLISLLEDNSASLEELYLTEVYLKVNNPNDPAASSLWIGNVDEPRAEGAIWVAEKLRQMPALKLKILRVTGLGYDRFEKSTTNYDLIDPSGCNKSFDLRFVEAATEKEPQSTNVIPDMDESSGSISLPDPEMDNAKRLILGPTTAEYDAFTFQHIHNTTSVYKSSIDGVFCSHNEHSLRSLQRIIEVVDLGMDLISAEITR